jgi:hypothetical protein
VKAKKIDMNPLELTTKLKEPRKTKDWFRQDQVEHLHDIISQRDAPARREPLEHHAKVLRGHQGVSRARKALR